MLVNGINNYNLVQTYESNHIVNTKETDDYNSGDESSASFEDEAAIYEHENPTTSQTIYNSEGVLLSAVSGGSIDRIVQENLRTLGFYDPIGPADGNLGSAASIQAIKNFQKVYGLSESGVSNGATRKKLDEVMRFYNNIKTADLAKVARRMAGAFDYDESLEIENTRRTWTFLRLGLGLNQKQAAGVMGNLLVESGLSPTNLQNDKNGPFTLHDTEYNYSTTDDTAYGLLQWKHYKRKAGLLKMASSMGSSVSDINVQFAYMKSEVKETYKESWGIIKSSNDKDYVTEVFYNDIEKTTAQDLDARKANAEVAYNALKSY